MEFRVVIVGALETNCYLVYCPEERECAIVDPGADPEQIFLEISRAGLKPVVLLNTHGHVDHTGANMDMKEHYGIPLLIHAADKPFLEAARDSELRFLLGAKDSPPADGHLEDGQEIGVGRFSLRVLHTPGHTPGSVCFQADRFLLSGDTLFFEGVGRTDLPGGSARDLQESIRTRILVLDESLPVLPGHGPPTRVGQEKLNNPFL